MLLGTFKHKKLTAQTDFIKVNSYTETVKRDRDRDETIDKVMKNKTHQNLPIINYSQLIGYFDTPSMMTQCMV